MAASDQDTAALAERKQQELFAAKRELSALKPLTTRLAIATTARDRSFKEVAGFRSEVTGLQKLLELKMT